MKINEIFLSIQGEGILSGLPTIFIRTTGCNLRCNWCDTKYAYAQGKEMSITEIVSEIKKMNCSRICITGGEPLLQEGLLKLLNDLIHNDYSISIETNGSLNVAHIPKQIMISLDIKCPSSKEHTKTNFKNLSMLKKNDQCKFIIKDKTDYMYAKKNCRKAQAT